MICALLLVSNAHADSYNNGYYAPTPYQISERQRILDNYYSNYLMDVPKRPQTRIEIQLENDYYSNYLEEIHIIIE